MYQFPDKIKREFSHPNQTQTEILFLTPTQNGSTAASPSSLATLELVKWNTFPRVRPSSSIGSSPRTKEWYYAQHHQGEILGQNRCLPPIHQISPIQFKSTQAFPKELPKRHGSNIHTIEHLNSINASPSATQPDFQDTTTQYLIGQ